MKVITKIDEFRQAHAFAKKPLQVTLLKWEIKYHRELTDYEKNLAMLENLVGKELF